MRRTSKHVQRLAALVCSVGLGPISAEYPGAGRDEFKSAAAVEFQLTAGPTFSLTVVGPTRIERSDPFDPGDGRLMVITEMVAMDLRGSSPLGAIEVRERGDRQSSGAIRQKQAGADFPADSYFDVFVDIETPLGNFHNDEPIRLGATISAIPPFQAQYMPEGTFAGVDLLDANGAKVGVIRHAVHFVGQRPSFSVAPQGPSQLDPADIFDVPRATPKIPHVAGLGLRDGDNVDGLSYGIDFIAVNGEFRFSVDPQARGLEGTAVRSEADKTPPQAHGDEFWTSRANLGSNAQELDENGDTAPPFPLAVCDDVDALTEPPTSFVDPNGDGVPENPLYFSLSAGSPSLAALGRSPADILRKVGTGQLEVFISRTALGLQASDDVDAFCLADQVRGVLFSLAPGSPSLMASGFGPADLFFVSNANDAQPPAQLRRFITAAQLGLRAEDNLNALKCTVPEVDYFFHSVLQGQFSDETELFNLWGPTKTLVAVGPNGEAFPSSSGADVVAQEMVLLSMSDLMGGRTTAKLLTPTRTEEVSSGTISDRLDAMVENVPRRLDVKPWGAGRANNFLNLNLQIQRAGRTLITGQPVNLFGVITEKPPARLEFLTQFAITTTPSAQGGISSWEDAGLLTRGTDPPGPAKLLDSNEKNQQMPGVELLDENRMPTGIRLLNVALFPNAAPAMPNISPGGIVNAASFQRAVAAEAIVALFGVNLAASSEEATQTPLPTSLAGTSITVTDSAGNRGTAALLLEGVDQVAGLAPLFFVSPLQINFLMPGGLAPGLATVVVTTDSGFESRTAVLIQNVAPALFTSNRMGTGVAAALFLRVNADGSRAQDLIFDPNTAAAVPVSLGTEGDQVFLILFGTGIRGFTSQVTATVGGENVPVLGAVPQGQFVGLDQANIGPLPRGLIGRGTVNLVLTVDGKAANTVTVAIQ